MYKKTKILHVLDGLNYGGAETFIKNMFNEIDHSKYEFNFLLRSETNDSNQISLYKKNGCKIFVMPSFPKHFYKNYKETKNFFKSYSFDVIHVHANSLIYVLPLILTKNTNKKSRILHSHNTKSANIIASIIHYINRIFIKKLASNYIACGEEAGQWMFGNNDFITLNNSVDTNRFDYNPQVAKVYKEKMNLNDCIIIGHVGRFVKQKNHTFLIDIFSELVKENDKYRLLLVGEGELKEEISKKIKEMNLEKYVIFLGFRNDIEKIFQVIDLLLFPSLYEGLPFVMIEAQAAGVPIIASDTISHKSKITDLVTFVSLTQSKKEWCKIVKKSIKKKKSYKSEVVNSHYDTKENSKILFSLYTRISKRNTKIN